MFELFTEGARRVVVRAQERTRQWGRPDIGTGELLAALAGPDGAEAERALAAVGVTVPAVRAALLGETPPTPGTGSGHIPFSPRMRRTLERAAALAVSPGDEEPSAEPALGWPPDYPGPSAGRSGPAHGELLRPGHLLLALLGDSDCTAVTVLRGLGVDPDELRASTRELLDAWPAEPGPTGRPRGVDRPEGRHRPAGTSRFPPAEDPSTATARPASPDDPGRAGFRARRPRAPGGALLGPHTGAAAGAAWAELQRRQARLPLWALRLWRGDEIIRAGEDRAARRLMARLPLSADEQHVLAARHAHAVQEILFAALDRQGSPRPGAGRVPAPARAPARALAALGRIPPAAATWALRRHPGPARRWINWLGARWTAALARCLRLIHRP